MLLIAGASGPKIGKALFNGADPDADRFGGETWIYPTGDGDTLSGWSSTDLAQWTEHKHILDQSQVGWTGADGASRHYLWAPDMVAANDHYYLYYSVGPQNPTPSRLGVAICDSPSGPCTDSGKPLLTGGDGVRGDRPDGVRRPQIGQAAALCRR